MFSRRYVIDPTDDELLPVDYCLLRLNANKHTETPNKTTTCMFVTISTSSTQGITNKISDQNGHSQTLRGWRPIGFIPAALNTLLCFSIHVRPGSDYFVLVVGASPSFASHKWQWILQSLYQLNYSVHL